MWSQLTGLLEGRDHLPWNLVFPASDIQMSHGLLTFHSQNPCADSTLFYNRNYIISISRILPLYVTGCCQDILLVRMNILLWFLEFWPFKVYTSLRVCCQAPDPYHIQWPFATPNLNSSQFWKILLKYKLRLRFWDQAIWLLFLAVMLCYPAK